MSVLTILNNRFKIGTRIAAGFISILALLAIVAGADYIGLTGAQTSTKTAGRIAQTFARVATIDTGFAQLRINTLVFATSGAAEAEKQGRELQRTMLETATTALAAFNDEHRKESMRRLIATLSLYSSAFDELVAKKTLEQRAAIDVARPMGAKLQADLSELLRLATAKGDWATAAQIGVVQELFLSARLDVNIFLQANDPKMAVAGQETIGKVPAALVRLREATADQELRSRAQALGPVVDQFIVAFNTTITTASDVYRLSDKMDKLAVTAREQINVITGAQLEALTRTRDESLASITQTITNSLSVTAAAFAAGLLLAWLIGRGITRPIRNMTAAMATLAGGALELEVPSRDRRDEIGDMAEAVQVFKENALRVRQMEAEQKEATTLAATGRKAEMHRMADAFQTAVGGIVDTVSSASTKLENAANTLTHSAENTQRLSGIVASASEESSSNVQSAASAADEMNTSVLEISRQVQNSSKIAQEAVAQARKTDARINELSQAAQRIGDVVKLISAVAEQTNLLALNATIEAARAGEAGRGFAVVASEVKALAAQTAKATEEISAQIVGMQTATADSVGAIKEIGSTIGRISEIAGMIAAAVEEQGAATQEIARNVGEAAKGTTLVATNISDVNRGAAETGTASAQVLSSAQSLSNESNHLKVEVEKFLATVRAA